MVLHQELKVVKIEGRTDTDRSTVQFSAIHNIRLMMKERMFCCDKAPPDLCFSDSCSNADNKRQHCER